MKLPLLLLLGHMAWQPAQAQSEPLLPPLAEYPTDMRLISGAQPKLQWTSTGSSTWMVLQSSNLQTWRFNFLVSIPSAVGWSDSVAVDLPAGAPQTYFKLTHFGAPATILSVPPDMTVPSGQAFTLTARTDGDFPLISRWYRDGTLIASVSNRPSSFISSRLAGSYQLTVANPLGIVTSRVAHVVFGPAPDLVPAGMSGRTLDLDLQFASKALVTPAHYRFSASGAGSGCDFEGVPDSKPGTGSYTFQRTGPLRATFFLSYQRPNHLRSFLDCQLYFSSPTNGTFDLQGWGYPPSSSGTGEFVLSP